ncbi:MAG: winged helix DNA-binding domain-containing protein [Trueperaceae bacterium]|nr:winged helix DNA-binding domain-containing protein [Trueperaceae bacterium]
MRLTDRQLNRASLARQLLLERERLPVVDAVRRVLALQAQEPASPYLALWNRVRDFDPVELDDAFRTFAVVKATLVRLTLHAVAAEDRAPFHAAMRPTLRAAGLYDERFRTTGLTPTDADALVLSLVAFAHRPRDRVAIEAMLAEHLGAPPEPGLWRGLRLVAPLVHAPNAGPWAFGATPSYVAAPASPSPTDEARARTELIRRYLAAFGPATPRDFARYARLRQTEVRPAFEALSDVLVVRPGPGGATLYDVPDAPLPDGDAPAPPRLLPMWDSVLLAYADRGRVLPEPYRARVIRRNGDVLPTVLVDGYVAGVWRPVDGGVEVTAFHALDDDAWDGVEREARVLRSLLAERDPQAYGRFGHWWAKGLPSAQVRVLSGA